MTHPIHRRTLLGGGIGALGAAALGPFPRASEDQGDSRTMAEVTVGPAAAREPTHGDYTVIYDHYAGIPMADGYILTDAPSLIRTADGALLCSVPLMIRGTPKEPIGPLLFFRSDDDGQTWSDPVTLFEEPFYNPSCSYVTRDGRFYWCCDTGRDTTYVIAGDLSRDRTDANSWRISEGLPIPPLPASLTRGRGDGRILEGNVVDVNGCLQISWRYMIDARDTVGIGVICNVDDDGQQLDYRFRMFHALPGGQVKFCIVWDEVSGLFWATMNLAVDGQDQFGLEDPAERRGSGAYSGAIGGNDRRFLMLFYGLDGLNWFPAGCVAWAGRLSQSREGFPHPGRRSAADAPIKVPRRSFGPPARNRSRFPRECKGTNDESTDNRRSTHETPDRVSLSDVRLVRLRGHLQWRSRCRPGSG